MIKFLYYALASSILTVVIFFYQIAMSIGFGPEPNFLIILIIAAITVHLLLVITILVALFFYLGLSGIRISF